MTKSVIKWVGSEDDELCFNGYVGLLGCYDVFKSSVSGNWRAMFCSKRLGGFQTPEEAKVACEKHLPSVIDDILDVVITLNRESENRKNYGVE